MLDELRRILLTMGGFGLLGLAACTTPNPDYLPRVDSISLSPGSLTPAFDSKTTMYSVDVDSTVSEVAMTAIVQDSDASMTVNGVETTSGQVRTISLQGPGLETPIPVVVATPYGGERTYTVTVHRAALSGNNKLQSMSLSPGALAPEFDPNTATYSVDVDSTVSEVAVTATLQDDNATMTVNGLGTSSGQTRTISLQSAGLKTLFSVVVTSPDGSPNTYTVTVHRAVSGNNKLRSLSVGPGTLSPEFSPGVSRYDTYVASLVEYVNVTALPDDPDAKVVIGFQITTQTSVSVQRGATTPIQIKVLAPDTTMNTYTVNVYRSSL